MYVVKWKHIESNEWKDFVKPKVFESLEKAQEFIKEEQESDNGMYEYKIFEVVEYEHERAFRRKLQGLD